MRYLLTVLALTAPLLFGGMIGEPTPKLVGKASTLSPDSPKTPSDAPGAILIVKTIQAAPAEKPAIRNDSVSPSGGAGFLMGGSNCVACVRALTGRGQNGNAGTWRASSSTPWVGAIMIFYPGEQGASSAGHVGVVQGVNPDGTINLAHCNWWSGETVFASTGKFF